MGVPIGLILSTVVESIVSATTGSNFLVWGWRIPFLLSGVLIIIGLYIRLRILETPLFAAVKSQKHEASAPILDAFHYSTPEILLSAGARFVEQAPFYLFTVFVITYGVEKFGMRNWLVANECQMVAMMATGVYWRPIGNVLEEELTLMRVNAQHMKAVPMRKTDSKDAEWIAELWHHGLLHASFVPPRRLRELREVTRYYWKLLEERARLVNRIQKVLDDSNIKLASVATDITEVSGRAILWALLDGEDDPEVLGEVARGCLQHRFLLKSQLRHLDFYDTQIAELAQEIARRVGMPTGPDDHEQLASRWLNGNRASSADRLLDGATDCMSHSTSCHQTRLAVRPR